MILFPAIQNEDLKDNLYQDVYVNTPELSFMFHIYKDSMMVENLNNALKRGQFCDYYSISFSSTSFLDNECEFYSMLIHWLDDLNFTEFISRLFFNYQIFRGITIHHRKVQSKLTFSPFVNLGPIREPKKWTIPHIWKALFAGQIKEVYRKCRFTDDYKEDSDKNFYAGKIEPLELAKKIIDDSSGWMVNIEEENEKNIKLSVNYSYFDYYQLIFNKFVEEC